MENARIRENANRYWLYFPSEFGHMDEWWLYFQKRRVAYILKVGKAEYMWKSYNMASVSYANDIDGLMLEIETDYHNYLCRNYPVLAQSFR